MSKYQKLDDKIIDAIGGMRNPAFYDLLAYLYPQLSFYTHPDSDELNTLASRLQALRKKGLIVFMKGWRLLPAAEK